ncbi:hypothetical protein BV25DRAFT_1796809 [Artomyces pyxidatus]|uniref:Uncharacterized protein n=1 Tax=Artomyces pyxidatus TaxID=48021 RepID=A0ACB8TE54_9AGAM|nr:hypothetical protein BV25DRAFT_1796809 [Artomyces pyxidatus]
MAAREAQILDKVRQLGLDESLYPLDESLYKLDEDETAFFKAQTGIQDDEELKKHLLQGQADAYKVFPYPCIRKFAWTKLKISRLFAYHQLLKLGREREGAILLDIGCCFGNDARKAIADGFPIQNVVASDLHQGFWDAGHKVFRTTPETFPVPFVPGDVFDPAHLAIVPPFTAPPTTPRPNLATLTSLNPLRGYVSAVHASSFFHLFQEEQQLHLARALAGLLAAEPGSMLSGRHAGLPEAGFRTCSSGIQGFCHSAESWKELWEGVFGEVGVQVDVEARVFKPTGSDVTSGAELGIPESQTWWLEWVVTRL